MASKPRKPRIIRETVKDSHTSHWDLDMLSHAELTALLCNQNGAGPESAAGPDTCVTPAATVTTAGKEPGSS